MSPEREFIDEINIFNSEVKFALRSLYTELAIHGIASKDKETLRALNYSPTFWNTIFSALQHSTFMTLGRIFDMSSKHNIHTLFKVVENNKYLFAKESFSARWMKNEDRSKIDSWLLKYLENVYVPTNADFRKFKKFIASQQKIYSGLYRPIRHQFGHKNYSRSEDVKIFFDKIQIRDLEKFCVRLDGIHEALWQLYYNGRGPLLPIKQGKYSTQNILKKKYKMYDSKPANVQFIEEASIALNLLKLGNEAVNKKLNRSL